MIDRSALAVALLALVLGLTLLVVAIDTRAPAATIPDTPYAIVETRVVYQVVTAIPRRTATPTVWPTRTPLVLTQTPISIGRINGAGARVEVGDAPGN